MWETVSHKFRNKNLSWSRETFFFSSQIYELCYQVIHCFRELSMLSYWNLFRSISIQQVLQKKLDKKLT